MNQILTQKWFLLQNIKDSSYFRSGVFLICCFNTSEIYKHFSVGDTLPAANLVWYSLPFAVFLDSSLIAISLAKNDNYV
jgi:hypothetical protein